MPPGREDSLNIQDVQATRVIYIIMGDGRGQTAFGAL